MVARITSELEQKYNVTITYPIRPSGTAAIGPQTLHTLDQSLMFLSPELVREVSAFFENRNVPNSRKITIAFDFRPAPGPQLASFNSLDGVMRIFIPRSDGEMLLTGTNPTAIVHEMGHAFHEMVEQRYGRDQLRHDFTAFNNMIPYSALYAENPDPTVFATLYGTLNYQEDFAETFTQLFTANRPGLGIADRLFTPGGERTRLGGKMAFMERLIENYITNNKTALTNARRVYTTPRHLLFAGINWSGGSLQYIGFFEPNGVFAAIESHINVTTQSSRWISELGGWHIVCTSGAQVYAFPGGAYRRAA
jgi:hypothetical protein